MTLANNWSREHLFFDGDAFYADLLQGIESASQTIEFEIYIFQADPIGRAVEAALIKAARRGVQVRLLVDGIGALNWIDKRDPELEKSGISFRVYHPVFIRSILTRLMDDIGLRRKTPRSRRSVFSRLNRRTHRKMCLIDGKIAWVGSQNISAIHSRAQSGEKAWRDTGARIEGEAVQDLIASFEFVWLRAHSSTGKRRWRDTMLPRLQIRRRRFSSLVRLNHTTRLRHQNYRGFIRKLKRARTRIWITNAYLSPSSPVIRYLVKAARRGVDVRLLVPRESDVFFMPWVASTYYKTLRHGGVRIFEYLPRFLHAKSVIIDDWVTVGTSNMNRRSLLHDFEVDVVLSQKTSLRALEEQFAIDLGQATEVRSLSWGLSGILGRVVTYFFKYWI